MAVTLAQNDTYELKLDVVITYPSSFSAASTNSAGESVEAKSRKLAQSTRISMSHETPIERVPLINGFNNLVIFKQENITGTFTVPETSTDIQFLRWIHAERAKFDIEIVERSDGTAPPGNFGGLPYEKQVGCIITNEQSEFSRDDMGTRTFSYEAQRRSVFDYDFNAGSQSETAPGEFVGDGIQTPSKSTSTT